MHKKWLYGGAFVVGMLLPGYLLGYLSALFFLFFFGSEYFQQKARALLQRVDERGDPIVVLTDADLWVMEITRGFALILFGCGLRLTGDLLLVN